MFSTLHDYEVLIGAGGELIVDLVITHEIMRPHRGDQERHADLG